MLMGSVSRQQSLARTPSGSEPALGAVQASLQGTKKHRESTRLLSAATQACKSPAWRQGCTGDSMAFGDISTLVL